jgi:prevent-host-death family protein
VPLYPAGADHETGGATPALTPDAAVSRERRVGVRELRDNLTRYLREVRHGASVLVTSHDEVIAQAIDEDAPLVSENRHFTLYPARLEACDLAP